MRAVIYARFSDGKQKEESIDVQLRECKAYAKKRKITIVGEYIDKALTGRTDKRPNFLKMIKDSAKNNFDAVITLKVDRFARNRYDSALYKAKLKQKQCACRICPRIDPRRARRHLIRIYARRICGILLRQFEAERACRIT